MNKNSFFIYLFFFVLIVSCQSTRHPELVFKFRDPLLQNEGWIVSIYPDIKIDSTEKVNDKYPLMIEQIKDTLISPYGLPISAVFFREILLPSLPIENTDTATISIVSRSLNLKEAVLTLFCVSKEEDIVFSDSVNINKGNVWSTTSFSFPLEKTRKIVLGIHAFGYDSPSPNAVKPQRLWLDKLLIQSLSSELWDNDNLQEVVEKEQIDPWHLIKIDSIFDLSGAQKIDIPDNGTIIGIGEAVHGSKTINQIELTLVKKMILYNSCRLVLFECDMFSLMLWNQYVQGKMPEDSINSIKKELLSTLFSPEEVGGFLVWLRKYNSTAKEKVHVQGIVPSKYGWGNQLFHYLYAYYNDSTSSILAPLLRKLPFLSPSVDVLDCAEKLKPSLKAIMGDTEHAMFLYALKNAVRNNMKSGKTINPVYQFLQRDVSMAENVNQFVSLYLENDQKACVIAHNGHVNKKLNLFLFPYFYPMGYYLHQMYGDKYYALGVFPGKGSLFGGMGKPCWEKSHLGPILPNSLEDACRQTGLATFFYPTSYFRNDLLYYRSVGNRHFSNEYVSGNLKAQMDGIVFVDEINPIHTKSYNPNEGNIIPEMIQREIEILKDIQKEAFQ